MGESARRGQVAIIRTSILAHPAKGIYHSYPFLPVELVRDILELAAWGQEKWDAMQLLLVSHAVRQWIIPIVYEHIDFDTKHSIPLDFPFEDRFLGDNSDELPYDIPCKLLALRAALEHSEVAVHVRRLDMPFSLYCFRADDGLFSMLNTLPRLQSLTLRGNDAAGLVLSEEGGDRWATPSFVRMLWHSLVAIGPRHPLFRKMTHLSIGGWIIDTERVFQYPALTHLAVHWDATEFNLYEYGNGFLDDLRELLSSKSKIQSAVIILECEGNPIDNYDQEPWLAFSQFKDERLVLWPVWTPEEVAETFRLDGPELWHRAEENWGKWSAKWRRLQGM